MKHILPFVFFFFSAVAVAAFFVFGKSCLGLSADDMAALFTGIGLAGIIATLWHERDMAADSERSHHELLESMRMQATVGARQAEVLSLSAHLPILENRISGFEGRSLTDTERSHLDTLTKARTKHRRRW